MADRTTTELVAVNADVVGFSRLMADDPETTSDTVADYRRLVEEDVRESSGTLVNFVGDNFMAVFADATDAMRAAISISSRIEGHNSQLPQERWVRFRMGIDRGAVTKLENQHFGDALNIAARIQEKARPGGVSVSNAVFRALDEPALRFRSTGHHRLKNIPEQVEIFEYSSLPTDPDRSVPGPGRWSLESPAIAVLPIHNETADAQTQRVSEMLRSDLVHRLVALPRLTVTDILLVTGVDQPAQYMLETGVLQVGDHVRVYAKVFQVANMNVVTSHMWAIEVDELFALIDTICDEVSRGVETELVIGEPARLYAQIGDPEAVHQIYQAWYHLTSGTRDGWARAFELYESVATAHPEHTYGRGLLAFAGWLGAAEGLVDDPQTAMESAFRHASTVIEMNDPTGLAHMVQGAIHVARGQTDEALAIIGQAHITRPTCDITYALEASIRRYLGHWERAVDLIETAIRLAAITPPWYPTVQACSLFLGGRLDQAAATAEEVIEHYPNSLEALLVLTATQTEMGLGRRARATAEIVRERFPALHVDEWLENHPFKDPGVIVRWRRDLALAGLIST